MPATVEGERTRDADLQRVAYVAGLDPSRKFGSLEEQILLQARAFQERGGCFLPVFSHPLGGEAARAYAAAGIGAEALPLHRFGVGRLRALLSALDRHQIELVHWSFYHPFSPYVWALSALRPRLRHFHTDHNSRWQGARPHVSGGPRAAAKNALLARYEQIVCISNFVATSLQKEGVRAQLTACPHFINTERFRPDPAERARVRRELGTGERFAVLFVAHLIEEKGGAVLLRALASLPADVIVWVVGTGPRSDALKRLAGELALGERAVFFGDRGRVDPFMQGADCLACPSLWEEASGLVNIEGLACGLPVVASRVGGIPEIVDDERTGFLVPPGDVDQLAAAIRRLHNEPELRARMSHEGRHIALQRYAAERRIPDYLDLYRRRQGGTHVR